MLSDDFSISERHYVNLNFFITRFYTLFEANL